MKIFKKSGLWKRLWKQNKLRIAFAMALGFGAACFSNSLHAQIHPLDGGWGSYTYNAIDRNVFTVGGPAVGDASVDQCGSGAHPDGVNWHNFDVMTINGNAFAGWGTDGGIHTGVLTLSDINTLNIWGLLDNTDSGAILRIGELNVNGYVNNDDNSTISGTGILASSFFVNSHIINSDGSRITGFGQIEAGDYITNSAGSHISGTGAGSSMTTGTTLTNNGTILAIEKIAAVGDITNNFSMLGTGLGSSLTTEGNLNNTSDIDEFHTVVTIGNINNDRNLIGTGLAGSNIQTGWDMTNTDTIGDFETLFVWQQLTNSGDIYGTYVVGSKLLTYGLDNQAGGEITGFEKIDIASDLINAGDITGLGATSTLSVGGIFANAGTIGGFGTLSITNDIGNIGATITGTGLRSELISHNGGIDNTGGTIDNFETVAALLDIDNTNGYIAGTGVGSSLTVASGGLTNDNGSGGIANFERVAVGGNTTNSGDITGTGSADSSFYTGTLNNDTTGVITGFKAVEVGGYAQNAGVITGTGFGSTLDVGADLTNDATGAITKFEQVQVTGYVDNSGTLTGTGGVNSLLNAGGYIYNLDGAAIDKFERIVAGGSDGAGIAIWNSTDAVSGLGSNIDGVRTIIAAGKIVNDVDASIYALVDGAGDSVPDASIAAVAIDNSGEIEGFTKVNLTGNLANNTGATLIGTGSAGSSINAGSVNNDGTITGYETVVATTNITNNATMTGTGIDSALLVRDGDLVNTGDIDKFRTIVAGGHVVDLGAGPVIIGGNINNAGNVTGVETIHADGTLNNALRIWGINSADSKMSASVINNDGDIAGFLSIYATGIAIDGAGNSYSISNTDVISGVETLWSAGAVINDATTIGNPNAFIKGSGLLTSSFTAFSLLNYALNYDLTTETSDATVEGFNNVNITTHVTNQGVIQGTYAAGSSFIVGSDLPPGVSGSINNSGALIRFDLVSASGDITNAVDARIGGTGLESSALYAGSLTNDGMVNRFDMISSGSFIQNNGIIGVYNDINGIDRYETSTIIANNDIINTGVIYGDGVGSLMVAKNGTITNTAITATVDGIISGFETIAANSDITNNANAVFQGTGTADSLFTAGGSINNSGDIADYTTVVAGHDINNLGVDSSIVGVSTLEALNGSITNQGLIDGNGPGSIITAADLFTNSGNITQFEKIAVGGSITNTVAGVGTGLITGTGTAGSMMVAGTTLTNDGIITQYETVYAKDGITNTTTGDITGTGTVDSKMVTAGDIDNAGVIADFRTIAAGGDIDNTGLIAGVNQLVADGDITNGYVDPLGVAADMNGFIFAAGVDALLRANSLDNTTAGSVIAGFNTIASATSINNNGLIAGTGMLGSVMAAGTDITNNLGGIITQYETVRAGGSITNDGTIGEYDALNNQIVYGVTNVIANSNITNTGDIYGSGADSLMLARNGSITNDGDIINFNTVVAWDTIANTGTIGGTDLVGSQLVAYTLDNQGDIFGFETVAATTGITNDGDITGLGVGSKLVVSTGDLANTGNIDNFRTIAAGGDIDNTGLITGVNTMLAEGDITNGYVDPLGVAADIDASIIAVGTDALLQANSLDNATAGSVIFGFNNIKLIGALTNNGLIATGGSADSSIFAGFIANNGMINGYETIAAVDGIANAGTITGTGLDSKLVVSDGDLDNTDGTITDFEKVAVAGNIDNTGGNITGTGGAASVLMSADGYITNNNNGAVRGTIAGFETIYVGGADANGIAINNQGDISGVQTIAAVGQINNEVGGNITALIDSNNRYVPDATVAATSLDNAGNIAGFTNVAVTEDITNQANAFITGTGMPDSIMKAGTTITNRGTITGYETIAATGSITNNATMTGTGVDSRLVSSAGDVTNTGTIDQFETIAAGGDIANTGAITGVNTLYADGDITNGTGVITAIGADAKIIANSLTNGIGRIENFNNIKLAQALTNNGYIGTVSSADSSIFAGLITNNGMITGYNVMASASSIQNVGAMVGTGNAGSMMNAATTITNTGAISGYETVYAKDGITSTNAITGTGTADSKMVTAGLLDNSGNIDDFRTIAADDIDNTGNITGVNTLYATGDITNGGGNITAIGADAAIIANSLTNGGGRIEDFNNIKLANAFTNNGYVGTISSADSSIFAGLITNNGMITGYNVMASASSIQNVGAMVGTGNAGSMMNAATTITNTGAISGYETVYAKDGITSANAITGTGTADSKMVTAGLLDNSGNINDFRTIVADDIANTGNIDGVNTLYTAGDITNGGGVITAVGADATIIADSLTNNGGQITNFNNIKLTDALINGGLIAIVNSADSSILAGSILNNGMIRGYNIMASAAGITNNSDIFGTGLAGSMMNAGTTIANDGVINDYETVAAKTGVTNNNTMTGTGLDSVLVVSNGNITNTAFISQFETIAAGGNIANSGNITGVNTLYATGDISNTTGNITAIGADASITGLSLTNGGGNITNFNNIKLANGLTNNGGTISTVAAADSSMLAGFITNNGNIAGYNSMKATTDITNSSTITGTQMVGSVMASGGTITNNADSTISGYETIAATGKITSDGNIEYTANPAAIGSVNSALLAGDLVFSGGITGYKTIASATDIKVADTGTVGIVDSDGNVWDGAKVFSAVRSIDNAGKIAGTGEHGSYVSAGWDLANTGIIRNFETVHVTGELKNEVDPAHFGSGLIKGSDSLDSALYAGSLINGLGADINAFNNYYISYDVENAGIILGESNPTSSFIAGSRVTNTGYIHGINDYYAAKTFNTGTAQAVIVNVNGEDVTFWADATGRALTAAEVAADPRLIVYKQAYIGGTDEAGSTFITGEINNLGSIIRGFETVAVNGNVYNKDDQNMFAIYDTDGTTIIGWEAGTTYGSLLVGTGTKNSLLQAGDVTNDAKSVISQFNQFVVSDGRYSNGKLVNDGTIHGTGMQDSLMQAGQLTNNTGGLIDGYNRIVVSAPAGGTAGSANGSFNNAGTIVGTDLAGSYIVATGDMINSGSITKFETIASAKNIDITNHGVFRGTGTAASALVVGGDLNNDSDYPTTTSISGFANLNVVGTVNNGATNTAATIFGTGKGSVAVLGALTNGGTFGQFEYVDITKGDQVVGPAPNVVNSGTLQEIERLRIAGNYTNTGEHGAMDAKLFPTVAGSWPTNHTATATSRDNIENRKNLGVRATYVDGNFTNTGGSLNLYVKDNKIDFIQANDAIINGGNVNLSGEMLEVGQNYVFIQTANGIKVMNQLTLDNPEDLAPDLFHAELKYGDSSKGRTQWDYTMAQQPQSLYTNANNPNQRINDYWVTLRRDFIYGDTYKVDPVTGSVWDKYHNLQTGTSITGQTNNQLQIGRYLDNIVYADMNFDSDLYYVLAALDSVSDPALNGVYDKSLSIDEFEAISGTSVAANVQNALDQLSGQVYLDNAVRGIHTNQFFSRQLANRLRSLSCNIDGLCEDDINGRTWAQFVGGVGSTKTQGGSSGYSSEMYGFMAGSDFLTRPGTRLGAYVGYGDSGLYTKNDVANSSKNRNYLMGLYGIHEDCWGYNMLTASGGYNTLNTKRHIEFGSEENGNAIRRDHSGKTDGYVVSTRFERGFDFCRDHWKIQPFLAFEYTHLNAGEVIEDEGGRRNQVTALTLDSYNMDSFISDLGARAVFFRICPTNCRPISIFAQASWIHELADTYASTKATFNPNMSRLQDCGEGNLMAFNSTQKFMVAGNNTGRDWANIGVGANWCLADNLLVYGQYDGTFNGRDQFHAGSVGMGFYW